MVNMGNIKMQGSFSHIGNVSVQKHSDVLMGIYRK